MVSCMCHTRLFVCHVGMDVSSSVLALYWATVIWNRGEDQADLIDRIRELRVQASLCTDHLFCYLLGLPMEIV